MRITVAIVSDTHTNSQVGLCPPRVYRDNGDEHIPSAFQRKLWACWLDFWTDKVPKDAPLIAVFNGDMVECDAKHRTDQLICTNPSNILSIAQAAIEPAIQRADKAVFIRGTAAHTGMSGWYEEELAKDTDTTLENSDRHSKSWPAWLAEIDGVVLDVKHKARLGGRAWTRPNALSSMAVELLLSREARRIRQPYLAVRGHRHAWADTFDNYDPVRIVATGGWQLPTDWAIGEFDSASAGIGGIVISINNGSYEVTKWKYQVSTAPITKLQPSTFGR